MQRLHIDWLRDQSEALVGTVVVAEAYATINPDVYTQAWNDQFVERICNCINQTFMGKQS
jgi:hypothetical protein